MTDSIAREPSLGESLDLIIGSHLAEIHTALPGKIEKYDAATGKADVKPVHLRFYEGEDGEEMEVAYPVITNVPVMFPRGGGAFVSLPLKQGDPVWLIFAQRSLDAYLETDGKQDVDPGDARRHHLSDAVCYPGGGTWRNAIPNAHADDLVIGLEDGGAEIHVTPSGEVWMKLDALRIGGAAAGRALAIAETVDARLGALESFATNHMHTAPPLGGPTSTSIAPFSPAAGSTASAKAFVDG
ncbi:hypothetical protein D3C72_988630 [compost metagenome]